MGECKVWEREAAVSPRRIRWRGAILCVRVILTSEFQGFRHVTLSVLPVPSVDKSSFPNASKNPLCFRLHNVYIDALFNK